jgi:hypothetical protein
MEDYVASDERTDARCTSDIAGCDFYIGIIAQRYGWCPGGRRPVDHRTGAAFRGIVVALRRGCYHSERIIVN